MASPHPDLPFIRSAKPLALPDGRQSHELSLLDLKRHLREKYQALEEHVLDRADTTLAVAIPY